MDDAARVDEGVTSRPDKKRNLVPFMLVGVLLVASILVAVLTSSSPSDGAAVVRNALLSTVQSTSVDFNLNENVTGLTSFTINVTGACSFSSVACNLNESFGGSLSKLGTASEEIEDGTVYIDLTNSLVTLPTTWISVPLNLSSTSSPLSGGTPLSGLAQLARNGLTVSDDGIVTKDGESLHEYTVTASSSQIQSQVNSLYKELPTWIQKQLASSTPSVNGYQADVYINSNNQIAELDASGSVSVESTPTQFTSTVTFSNFGAPVTVTVPPANEVTSLSSLTAGL